MRTSLIINTACGDPYVAGFNNPHRSSTYGDRFEMVQRIIEEADFDEIIVAGRLPEVPDKVDTFVELLGGYGDRRDGLLQRELGARASTGQILIFTHDDHLPQFSKDDIPPPDDWDILVPKRIHGLTGQKLNNGEEQGYMGGHTLCMIRPLWVRIPWISVVPDRCWDLPMTKLWLQDGARIAFSDILVSVDLEANVNEV